MLSCIWTSEIFLKSVFSELCFEGFFHGKEDMLFIHPLLIPRSHEVGTRNVSPKTFVYVTPVMMDCVETMTLSQLLLRTHRGCKTRLPLFNFKACLLFTLLKICNAIRLSYALVEALIIRHVQQDFECINGTGAHSIGDNNHV